MTERYVIAIGNENKFRKIISCVSRDNIEISVVPKISEALSRLKNNAYDLILVDSSLDQSESICQCFYENFKIPVILLVSDTNPRWRDYCSFKVDGFLCEESSDLELVARIKACARCTSINK
jgi:DNA-binding response OmpR family regulator